MRRIPKNVFLLLAALAGASSIACQSGGIGDPCIPEDEYKTDFPGFTQTQVSVESRSFQCESRVCLVAYFAGRVSCPYGQNIPASDNPIDPQSKCYLPGTPSSPQPGADGKCSNCIDTTVTVVSQLTARPPEKAVYCSCRCDGPDKNVKYCECPSGYACQKLVSSFGVEGGGGQLVGSYCVKQGTQIADPNSEIPLDACSSHAPGPPPASCGDAHPDGI